jgi:hypothetical protein
MAEEEVDNRVDFRAPLIKSVEVLQDNMAKLNRIPSNYKEKLITRQIYGFHISSAGKAWIRAVNLEIGFHSSHFQQHHT